MKRIHWIACGSAAVLGCVLLPSSPSRRVAAQAPPPPATPAIPATPAPPAAPTDAPAEDKPVETVLRMYDVSDLVRGTPDRPLGTGVLPPTQLNGSMLGGRQQSFPNGSTNRPAEVTPEQRMENLVTLIQQEVAGDTWKETGGALGSIRAVENMLLIHQTAENQRKVADLLEQYRKARPGSRAVTVHADWLWLNPGELAQVVRPGRPGTAGREIDPAAVAKLGPKALYAHGQITCGGGQTVHLLSGHVRTLVENLDAAVGTGASAYQPEVDEVLEGAALQVTPGLQGETAVVDVLGFVSGWAERGEPYRFIQHDGGAGLPPTRPSDPASAAGAATVATMDRMNVVAQEFSTTARMPLGKAVVVGGMTLEPEGSGAAAGAGRGDAKAGEGRQLYLVLRVDVE